MTASVFMFLVCCLFFTALACANEEAPCTSAEEELFNPIVIDLNNDGLINFNYKPKFYFDIDNDGFAEAISGVSGLDAYLAIDLNKNKKIDNASELLGIYPQNLNRSLKKYDTDGDFFITPLDTIWADISIWQDINNNGVSEQTELFTLEEKSVKSIPLKFKSIDNLDKNLSTAENFIIATSHTKLHDETTRITSIVQFAYSNANTIYKDEYTMDVRSLFLPSLRGHGLLPHLHIASAKNKRLIDLSTELTMKSADLEYIITSYKDYTRLFTQFLYVWAGVDCYETDRGEFIDPKKLAFVEKVVGEKFLSQGNNGAQPNYQQTQRLLNAFNIYWQESFASYILQTPLKKIFILEDFKHNPFTDKITGNISGINPEFVRLAFNIAQKQTDKAGKMRIWANVVDLIDVVMKTKIDRVTDETVLLLTIEKLSQSSEKEAQIILDTIFNK
jgi:hypothetical protein